jgi:hypothetical protein
MQSAPKSATNIIIYLIFQKIMYPEGVVGLARASSSLAFGTSDK